LKHEPALRGIVDFRAPGLAIGRSPEEQKSSCIFRRTVLAFEQQIIRRHAVKVKRQPLGADSRQSRFGAAKESRVTDGRAIADH
jgi:hypothetical protein